MKGYLLLTSLENVPVVQEERLHLVDTARGDKGEVEDGKETKLHGEGAVAHFPEGEAAEEGCEDVQGDLVPHVVLFLVSLSFLEREREGLQETATAGSSVFPAPNDTETTWKLQSLLDLCPRTCSPC